jgi:hypothetical protein
MMQQPSGGVAPADQQPQQYQQPPQQWMMMSQQQQQAAQAAQAGWAQQQAAMQQQPQQYTAAAPNQGSDEIRSLWIGDLLQWMDESYILSCFGPTGEVITHIHMKLQFLNLGFTFMILKRINLFRAKIYLVIRVAIPIFIHGSVDYILMVVLNRELP